jgi:hypothetical protein
MTEPANQLQKAYIEVEAASGPGEQIPCMFNPEQFSFSTSNRWGPDTPPGQSVPVRTFGGNSSGTFGLKLVFDTTREGGTVTTYTNKLLQLMKIDETLQGHDDERGSGRPPWIIFHWGTHLHTYRAVITSLTIAFTYFASDGTPLRANVDMSCEQYEPDDNWARQNPTSGTPKPHRTHQVQVGDSLDRLAARYYGDSTQWRRIASANGVRDPLALRPGTVLAIPERSAS